MILLIGHANSSRVSPREDIEKKYQTKTRRRLGGQGVLFEIYFEHYKKLVYLAQTENEQWQKDAEQYAKDFGFEYEYRLVGTGSLDSVFDEIDIKPLEIEG